MDHAGNAYLVGDTKSDESTFPVFAGPDLIYNGNAWDAFVAKVDPSGIALVYAGYIGGAGEDHGRAVVVDSAGAAYVLGQTSSTEASFPVAGGPDLTYNGGNNDAFLAKVNPAGKALEYAGYLGGSRGR